jgi:hypothetical protein
MNTVCPVHSQPRHGASPDDRTGDKVSSQVNWAGLPVDLDLAFSRKQRDKVYVQHLMRKREAQLWRWLRSGAQVCICDLAGEDDHLDAGAGQAHVRSLSADMR